MKYAVIQYHFGELSEHPTDVERIATKNGWIVSMMHSNKKESQKTFKYMGSNMTTEGIRFELVEFKDDELIIRYNTKDSLKVSGIRADEMNLAEHGGDGVYFFRATDKDGVNYFEA